MTHLVFVLQEPTPYRSPHLARLAAEPGLDVTVVYAARTVQRRTWRVADDGAIFLRGPSLPLARVLHHDLAITPGIWPLLGRLRPDAVVVGGWSIVATQLAILWCRTHGVPYLLMSDSHLEEPRPGWVRVLKRLVLPRLVPQAAGWLVPGSLAQRHVAAYGADERRVVRFPLTVDVGALAERADKLRPHQAAARGALEIEPDEVAVISVGRLIRFKSHDLLVTAAARARAETGRPIRLVLVGEGPLEEELRDQANAAGVPVTFTGLLEGDDLVRAYVAADVFALLSRRETWGVVVNEAMACGLPLVLSAAVGAAADLLRHEENGILVPTGDARAAAAAIGRLATDAALRNRFGARSRELIGSWGYDESVAALARLAAAVTSER